MKILFIFPNDYLNIGVPHGLATIVAILKSVGHEVRIFDQTFIKLKEISDTVPLTGDIMAPTEHSISDLVKEDPLQTMEESFQKELSQFDPDLIALSSVSYTFDYGVKLLEKFKDQIRCKVIAGGVHPTIEPEDALKPDIIDFICVGEGDKLIVEVCDCLSKGKDCRDLRNLGYKNKSGIYINELRAFVNLDEMPSPDWGEFDKRHFFRPFMGKIYKGGFYIMSRGCPYKCTYCISGSMGPLRKKLNACGKYFRYQSPKTTVRHLSDLKRLYGATWFKFADDSMMSMPEDYIEELMEGIKPLQIKFGCSIRPETTTPKKVAMLKEMGCVAMSIGLETGNEEIRKKTLNRKMTNEQIKRALAIIKDYEIRPTTFNMIGLPGESRDNVFETIRFNRSLKTEAATISVLYPHPGTPIAEKYKKRFRDKNGNIVPMTKASQFEFSQMSPQEVDGLAKTFNLYMFLPEELWPIIKHAERDDKVGNEIFESLVKYSLKLVDRQVVVCHAL